MIMNLIDLINDHRNRLDENPYDCLLFALQLPSVCSRIEYPKGSSFDFDFYKGDNGVDDGSLYKVWLYNHIDSFKPLFYPRIDVNSFINDIYKLRCKLTHTGILCDDDCQSVDAETTFYFVDNPYQEDAKFEREGCLFFLPLPQFCRTMYNIAENVIFGHTIPNVTPYSELLLSSDDFHRIQAAIRLKNMAVSDASDYDDKDWLLKNIYDRLFVANNPFQFRLKFIKTKKDDKEANLRVLGSNYNTKEAFEKFYAENPDGVYEIWDFCNKYGCVFDENEYFIKKKYNEDKSELCKHFKKSTTVLCLSKKDYNRMCEVWSSFDYFDRHYSMSLDDIL